MPSGSALSSDEPPSYSFTKGAASTTHVTHQASHGDAEAARPCLRPCLDPLLTCLKNLSKSSLPRTSMSTVISSSSRTWVQQGRECGPGHGERYHHWYHAILKSPSWIHPFVHTPAKPGVLCPGQRVFFGKQHEGTRCALCATTPCKAGAGPWLFGHVAAVRPSS